MNNNKHTEILSPQWGDNLVTNHKDFIFIIGASGVGKTTLAKWLFNHYQGVYVEQHMVPEFFNLGKTEDEKAISEEKTCFTMMIMILKQFHTLGYGSILWLDFNDIRTGELPIIFKGYNFIIIRLFSSDFEQHKQQMLGRESWLIDIEQLDRAMSKIMNRELLPNEVALDIAGKTPNEILKETIILIDEHIPLFEYEYVLPSREQFVSWVKANNL